MPDVDLDKVKRLERVVQEKPGSIFTKLVTFSGSGFISAKNTVFLEW